MATFVEFHVWVSGKRISIAIDAISRIATIAEHASIHCMDGGYVEVMETYEQAQTAIMAIGEGGGEFLVPVTKGADS